MLSCPFCGADKERFVSAEEGLARFKVVSTGVNDKVTRVNSRPALGYERAAFRIETGQGVVWIDCPSPFDTSLLPGETILFTHHHFLGAVKRYRELLAGRQLATVCGYNYVI